MKEFIEIEKHLEILEDRPKDGILTKGLIKAYCISHDIYYIDKYDKEKIIQYLNKGFIVCYADHITCAHYKPYLYTKSADGVYVHCYINFKNKYIHQLENW